MEHPPMFHARGSSTHTHADDHSRPIRQLADSVSVGTRLAPRKPLGPSDANRGPQHGRPSLPKFSDIFGDVSKVYNENAPVPVPIRPLSYPGILAGPAPVPVGRPSITNTSPVRSISRQLPQPSPPGSISRLIDPLLPPSHVHSNPAHGYGSPRRVLSDWGASNARLSMDVHRDITRGGTAGPTLSIGSQDETLAGRATEMQYGNKRKLEETDDQLGLSAGPRAISPRKMARKEGTPSRVAADSLLDVAGITVTGEEANNVPVYDTCDTVRRRIRTFLQQPEVTQAAFLRALAGSCTDGRKFQAAQLNRFLAMSGPTAGNTSGIYYAAYVFFEKVRVRDGKAKAADRLEMERIHPGGMNTTDVGKYITLFAGEKAAYDKYGQLQIY